MIDETMRPISSRETVQDYTNYMNKRKAQIAQEKKLEFEESLRQSAVREVKSNSALFGASRNIFEQQLTKDIAVNLDDMDKATFKRFQGTMITFNLSSSI